MKKIFLFFIIISSLFANDFAVVDLDKLFKSYNKAIEYEKKYSILKENKDKQIDELKKNFNFQKQKLLSTTKSNDNLISKINKLELKLQEDIEKIQDKFFSNHRKNFSLIALEIEACAFLVAKQQDFDYLFEKKRLIYGGVDITDSVLDFINSEENFELKDPILLDQ